MNSKISKQILAIGLAMLIVLSPLAQAQEDTSGSSERERTITRTKAAISHAQAANRAVEVKLRNGEKFCGNVSDFSAEEFTLSHPSQGFHNFAYSDVNKVKTLSKPLSVDSTAKHENKPLKVLKWIGLGAGFAAALFYCSQMGCTT